MGPFKEWCQCKPAHHAREVMSADETKRSYIDRLRQCYHQIHLDLDIQCDILTGSRQRVGQLNNPGAGGLPVGELREICLRLVPGVFQAYATCKVCVTLPVNTTYFMPTHDTNW